MMKQYINESIAGVRTVFQDKRSYTIAAVGTIGIGYLYYWLLNRVTTLPTFIQMAKDGGFGSYSDLYTVLYAVTTIATIIAFGVSLAVLIWLWRHSIFTKGTSASSLSGTFVGALGAACPVCGAFLLSLLGVSGGLSVFPLQGLELKFLSLGLIAGAGVVAARNAQLLHNGGCKTCAVLPQYIEGAPSLKYQSNRNVSLNTIVAVVLAVVFLVNQLMIGQAATALGMQGVSMSTSMRTLFGVKTTSSAVVIAPALNPDGKTTSLVEQPTITEVPGNPNTGDVIADAKAVVFPTGKPFYAPEDISFDDPINAQKKWGAYEKSITLSGNMEARYNTLISTMVCSYCCGGPTNVTLNKQCGCAHAKAVRGFYKYMLQTYGDAYTNEQLVGESHRWYALWYPKGMLEDYLLATGNEAAMPHESHGGAGVDGKHGLK